MALWPISTLDTSNTSTLTLPQWVTKTNLLITGANILQANSATIEYTTNYGNASNILTRLKTVDGAGSGLDADLLDGQHANYYVSNTYFQSVKTAMESTITTETNAASVLTKIKTVDGAGSGLDADLIKGATPSAQGLWAIAKPLKSAYYTNVLVNGSMLINQERYGQYISNSGSFAVDQWSWGINSGGVVQVAQSQTLSTYSPYGSFPLYFKCSTADSSIAAGEYAFIYQSIEDMRWANSIKRAPSATAFLVRFWVKTNKAGTYSYGLRKPQANYDYTILRTFTISAGQLNQWVQVTGTFNDSISFFQTITPSTAYGTQFFLTFSAGSTFTTSNATGAWVSGNFFAHTSQVNFLDNTNNELFLSDVEIISNDDNSNVFPEFISMTFDDDLHECLRYWEKSYDYTSVPGSTNLNGSFYRSLAPNQATWRDTCFFKKQKRQAAAITVYSAALGNVNAVYWNNGSNYQVGLNTYPGQNAFKFTVDTPVTTAITGQIHWVANARN